MVPVGISGYSQRHVQVVDQVPLQRTNRLAITSAIVGILAYFICPFIGAAIAVVMGHAAHGQIRRINEGGWGWATAGLVLGYVHFVIWGLILVLLFGVWGGLAVIGPLWSASATPTPASAAGIPCDHLELTQVHYHAALQILYQGKFTPIPANIGRQGNPSAPVCFYWLHVDQANQDVIHIESPAGRTFTLGDFFSVWSVWGSSTQPLDTTHVWSFTLTPDQKLVVYVDANDGKGPQLFTGDPKTIVLKAHEVITIEISPPTASPPPVFDWMSAANTGL